LPIPLDTHALIWWLAGDMRLVARTRDAIESERSQVFVSAASAWEIATKVRLGKLPGEAFIAYDIGRFIFEQGFQPLAISLEHGQRAGALPGPIMDPFDRMLIAQAILDGLHLVSIEQTFDAYGVLRLW
jgi:PIN domain nuclease of toxin-antitoxin system